MPVEIVAPFAGRVVPLDEVPDEVFAQGMAGDGVGLAPAGSGDAVAPMSGLLAKLFAGGHAFGIRSDEGVELIVHIGLDTVELQGTGFEKLATEGDRVQAGQPIVRFDLNAITESGHEAVSPVVVANSADFPVTVVAGPEVRAGEPLLRAAT